MSSSSPAPPASPAPESPRGPRFFYGRVIVATAFAATFSSVVFFNPVLGVFASYLEEAFGWSRAEIALALTVGGVLAAVTSPGIGWAIDRWGGRWVIGGSAIVMAVCLVGLANMTALWQLLAFYAVGRALAVGAMTPAAFVAVSNWYIRGRAMVAGIVAVGSRVGMAVFPLLVAVVIAATGTWRAGWYALLVVTLVVGVVPPLLFMRRRPEDLGLRPDGDPPEPLGAPDPALAPDWDRREFTLREALRTRAYWFLGFGLSFILFAGGSVNFHQVPHLVDQGLPRTQAAFIVTVFSTVGGLGGLLGGAIATRATVRWTMVVALAGMAGGVLLLLVASSVAVALVYAVVYGVFFGAMVALNQVIYADYFGRRSMGLIRGSHQPVQMGMNAVGPFATGLWVDRTGSYEAPFILFAVFFLIAAGALVLSPYPQRTVGEG
ncbi:MAG: MFS transporter [Dehalococcoidia bacterium]|nr:MFS transporter [Dehalococcoidia bacterium]